MQISGNEKEWRLKRESWKSGDFKDVVLQTHTAELSQVKSTKALIRATLDLV